MKDFRPTLGRFGNGPANNQHMTIDKVFAHIEGLTNLERTPGVSMRPYRLDRMRRLLELFEDPHLCSRIVHIAGSKGKGSTGAYISSTLNAAGFRAGLYTSPHVSSYKERITLAGMEIEDAVFIDSFKEIRDRIPEDIVPGLPGKESPTTFELLTILAFLVFRRIGCSWAVIETGIGGRLDATNLVVPDRAVITPIELEHTQLLGDTIEEIASEKAGIIKPGTPTYVANINPDALKVIEQRCTDVGARLVRLADRLESYSVEARSPRTRAHFAWRDGETEVFELGMNGDVQAENAALAAIVCRDILAESEVTPVLANQAIRLGLASAVLPGRMETISDNPVIILDAAHTPSSIARLIDSFCAMYPEPRRLIFGSVDGKNHSEMARLLAPHFEKIVVSTPGTFKTSDPDAVWRSFCEHHDDSSLETAPEAALQVAVTTHTGCDRPSAILVTGSFYMISQIRDLVKRGSLIGS